MTPEEEVLGRVVDILLRVAVPYMITGSIATSYHGRPRATHDADVIIDPAPEQLEAMLQRLEAAGFYVDPECARDALRQRRQFNVIDIARATKVDLIIRKARPFSVEEFRRRQPLRLAFGQVVDVVSAEDAVLSKLEWARRSGDSERQIRDAAGVLELNPDIDRGYVERWAGELGVKDLWDQISQSIP
ncbi:MAG TPA: hypothetical protein VLD67_03310 [Vicinamibacterales bacterium]|nr:hypothetical protein [Vicinamibacterales bacterium]